MKVDLLHITPEPYKTVYAAARVCYTKKTVQEILDTEANDLARVIKTVISLYKSGHLSPFEHVTATFVIDGVSRSLSHQLVRHRIASYNQKSQRYVMENEFKYVIPDSIKNNPKALEIYHRVMSVLKLSYNDLINEGIPAEDARYILPNATETQLIMTMNLRQLIHLITQRSCNRAQKEFRDLVSQIKQILMKFMPELMVLVDKPCISKGKCPEGKFSCKIS